MKTILFVDGLAFCRELFSEAVTRAGYEVLTAPDGIEALEVLKNKKIDLVILESRLENMDGLSVLRIMRSNPDFKKIPAIMLTAHENRHQIVQAIQSGVQEYVLKSQFTLEGFLARIAKHVGSPARTAAAGEEEPGQGNAERTWGKVEMPIEEIQGEILPQAEPIK